MLSGFDFSGGIGMFLTSVSACLVSVGLLLRLKAERLRDYLSSVCEGSVEVLDVRPLGGVVGDLELKGFGYGVPYVVEFRFKGSVRRVVLETLRPGGFGHDYFADRAGVLLMQHETFNKLPCHVRCVDVGSFLNDGETLRSLRDCGEFFLLTDYVEGELYHKDLDRIKAEECMKKADENRCLALSDYLVKVHAVKKRGSPELYVRYVRDLLGHGEEIFGLTDSYPAGLKYADEEFFVKFEKACVEWRWRLKHRAQRLAQVHGDFHPWNVLFREGLDFTVLDRSRTEWGEPADDVTAMTVNYLFYSLQCHGELKGAFEKLFLLFWRNYLEKTGDDELLEVVQPFYGWRCLVLASPLWYPQLSVELRQQILRFASRMLETERFAFEDVESYFK
jgi:hypothetical protein